MSNLFSPSTFAGCTKIYGHKDKYYQSEDGKLHPLIDVIVEAIGRESGTVIDGCSGTQLVGSNLKNAHHITVIANDYRKAAYYCGKALVENDHTVVDADTIDMLKSGPITPGPVTKLLGTVLGEKNALQYDLIIRNLQNCPCPEMVRHVAFWGLLQVIWDNLDKYILRGAHRDSGAAGNEHIRDLDLIPSWEHWLLCEHPRFICNENTSCEAHNKDVVDFMRGRPDAKLLYLDLPYASGNYFTDYKTFEDLCWMYEGKIPGDPVFRTPRNPPHRFDNRADFLGNLAHLLIASAHIPRWVISINTSSPVSPEEIASIARSLGRSVEIRRYKVPLITNTKRRKPDDNHECLIICTPSEALDRQVSQIRHRIAELARQNFEEGRHDR